MGPTVGLWVFGFESGAAFGTAPAVVFVSFRIMMIIFGDLVPITIVIAEL